MKRKLSIGVVGAGVFGGYHANKCANHTRVDFIGVFDPDQQRASKIAKKHGVSSFTNFTALLTKVDAMIIACPARYHGEMALEALKAGKHILVEKPLAHDAVIGRKIVDLAAENNCIVQVGHQERFVIKAIGLDQLGERPTRITARRMGRYSERGTDVSATLDLMTHDLDIILWLMAELPQAVKGQSIAVRSNTPDAALAFIEFSNGSARLEASRVEEGFERLMVLDYPSGRVEIDFNAKTLTHNTRFDLNRDFGEDSLAKDSLGAATNAFIASILDGDEIVVTAADGYAAMKLALEIDGDG